jgi:hypothetical protein
VYWPDGTKERFANVPAVDRLITIVEGKGIS